MANTWFLNKETGVKWEISDADLIERLSKNDNYEEVKGIAKEEVKEVIEEVKEVIEKKETKPTKKVTKKSDK